MSGSIKMRITHPLYNNLFCIDILNGCGTGYYINNKNNINLCIALTSIKNTTFNINFNQNINLILSLKNGTTQQPIIFDLNKTCNEHIEQQLLLQRQQNVVLIPVSLPNLQTFQQSHLNSLNYQY